ncbi:chorismate mutase [Sulfuracidifex metallicus]|uniref:chorismate mutase n=1 Tax=Sulfuracidifex metallicus TaxID=47303 RepID=UPI002274F5B0|nr:chorismate mutase [Sulfuracidifex metallicus]MCY0850589.1 chorismate mutase [Sulfuracidifex metallicus]
MTDISSVREEIDKVDEQILSLISLRFKLVGEVGKIKQKDGRTITDKRRENEVMEKWVSRARGLGIPESFVKSILPLIFSYSKMLELNPDEKRRVVILGYGGMARSLTSLLSLVGHEVVITGRNLQRASNLASEFRTVSMNMKDALKWGEFIIVAIPPTAIVSGFLDNVLPLARGKTLMDISSSKNYVFSFLEKASVENGFRFVSTHPLFGPSLYPVGEKIAIIPSSTSTNINDVIEFWKKSGLSVIETDPDSHEKAMSIVQVLVHFYMMGLSKAIDEISSEMGVNPSDFETTNFREVSKSLERVNYLKDVIIEIQENNPYSRQVREAGIDTLKRVNEEINLKKGKENKT